jgi:hypothetical protein
MEKAMIHYKSIVEIDRGDNAVLIAIDDIENNYGDNPNVKKGDRLYVEFGCDTTLYARGCNDEKTWKVSIRDTDFHLLKFMDLAIEGPKP